MIARCVTPGAIARELGVTRDELRGMPRELVEQRLCERGWSMVKGVAQKHYQTDWIGLMDAGELKPGIAKPGQAEIWRPGE